MTRLLNELAKSMLHFRNKPLPDMAETFLKEHSASRRPNTIAMYRAALHHFHRFITQSKITIGSLTRVQIDEFDEDLTRHGLRFVTRRAGIRHVHTYLRWLESRDSLPQGFSATLFPDYKPEFIQGQQTTLPDLAVQFLEILGTVNKPSTVGGYRACLRAFYKIHWKKHKKPYQIDRTDIEEFMLHLKNRQMGVNQRAHRLFSFRKYLDWLYDHRKLKIHPDDLLKSSDFPKKEQKLPRPFPVDVDLEIQRRLWESDDIDHLGLLLMRRCGLRCGELRSLTLQCVEQDLNGNWFLKVPLGKLNTERIFPLDDKTVDLIKRIQNYHQLKSKCTSATRYLISNPWGRRRSGNHFNPVLRDVCKGLHVPGGILVHRLRHSFATSLLSAGISITTLKALLGHKDIRMTLNYAAVTQETIRREYFEALAKIHSRYDVASYPLKTPDLHTGMNRAFYEAQKLVKKTAEEKGSVDKTKLTRLLYRLNLLRHECSVLLKQDSEG